MAQQARYLRDKQHQETPSLKHLDKLLAAQIQFSQEVMHYTKEIKSPAENRYVSTVKYYSWMLQPRTLDLGYWAIRNLSYKK